MDYQHSGHLDFAYIKDQNAGTNKVEVHIGSGASTSQTRVQEVATTFGEGADRAWQLFGWDADGILDLSFIKTSNTGTGDVQVHMASGACQTDIRRRQYNTEKDGFVVGQIADIL